MSENVLDWRVKVELRYRRSSPGPPMLLFKGSEPSSHPPQTEQRWPPRPHLSSWGQASGTFDTCNNSQVRCPALPSVGAGGGQSHNRSGMPGCQQHSLPEDHRNPGRHHLSPSSISMMSRKKIRRDRRYDRSCLNTHMCMRGREWQNKLIRLC